jgi:hypothetical protein
VHTECSWCCSSVLRGPKVARPATFSNEPAPVSVGRWQVSHRHPPSRLRSLACGWDARSWVLVVPGPTPSKRGEFRPHD